eukprot:291379_1
MDVTTPTELLTSLYVKKDLSDVTFEVGEERTEFVAHRLVLAARSPVFKAMFFGGMRESQLSETVGIDDVSPAAFEFILKYIYTGNVKEPSDADLVSIIYAAEKYQMCDIVDKCEQRLKWVLKISTVCGFYAQTFGMFDKAADICLKFILRYFDIIISRPSRVKNLSAACWESILSSDLSVSSEVKLFNSLLVWSKVSSQNREAVLKLIQ